MTHSLNQQIDRELLELSPELERYELYENPALNWGLNWEVNRREFMKITGGGLVVALLLNESLAQQPAGRGGRGGGQPVPQEVGAWLHIGEDNSITVYTGKTEVGQNIRTSLAQAVADELRVPIERIGLVMADTQRVPFDGGTSGSRSTPAMAPQLRRAAAAAREALLDLAVEQNGVSRDALSIRDGAVFDAKSNKKYEFGSLTKGQKLMKVVEREVAVTPADQWQVAGTSVAKVDGRSFVTGQHQYSSDIKRDAMQFGKVLRPASFKATLSSLDTSKAEAMPDVKVVRDGEFVGVVAPSEHAAAQALATIEAQWKEVPQTSSEQLSQFLREHPSAGGGGRGGGGGGGGGGQNAENQAAVAEGLKQADHKLAATYNIAYIAHAPLEPRAAVAEFVDGKLTVWTGTQQPFRVRGELATATGVAPENVRVIVPDTGAGYGGKHSGDAAVEAARLAKATGKPVKLIWTREEEFTWAYFRPAGVIDVSAGMKSDGTLSAWEFHNYNSGGSGLPSPYDVLQYNIVHGTEKPLRDGSYRALASTANNFARESHMDDLAQAVKMDPLAFRLKNLKHPRLRAVLEAAAEQFGWGKTKPSAGQGFGLACGTEKASYVATCAEIAVDPADQSVRIVRLVTAFECGAIVNPDHLRSQVEGCVIQGIGGALFEAIHFADGKILNPRFSRYRVPRFSDLPIEETVLIDRRDLASAGAGETPIIGVAPAIGNAIFAATGTRLRNLPMIPGGLKAVAQKS